MGFYGPEPFDTAEATYVWTGLRTPGFFRVTVKGNAPNFTTGITLVRDPHFVGGLAIDVMGWTGPIGKGQRSYTVSGSFNGMYLPKILIVGSNKRLLVDVKEIPFTSEDDYVKHLSAEAKELEPA
ncbi:hypothetical protein [Caulobacter sp. X]|uniref:hypothetical protein n=1 Tax=Caulobacter sp. X TaxID=2048901 RepID=UPI000C15EAD2|nr:hypothetical protein [Caulobacter sp. X]PIB96785.1 hypothetical protein CSW60_20035 [Caulobacter sp. X]